MGKRERPTEHKGKCNLQQNLEIRILVVSIPIAGCSTFSLTQVSRRTDGYFLNSVYVVFIAGQ